MKKDKVIPNVWDVPEWAQYEIVEYATFRESASYQYVVYDTKTGEIISLLPRGSWVWIKPGLDIIKIRDLVGFDYIDEDTFKAYMDKHITYNDIFPGYG